MMRLSLALFAFLLAFGVSALPAMAKDKSVKSAEKTLTETVFSEAEKAIIEGYFGKGKHDAKASEDDAYRHHDTHGKAKHKVQKGGPHAHGRALPPGLQKHLEKYGTLPPGLEGRDLPRGLAEKLPAPHEGTKRIIIDNDVVLIEEATHKVLDILKDVLSSDSPQ